MPNFIATLTVEYEDAPDENAVRAELEERIQEFLEYYNDSGICVKVQVNTIDELQM